MLNWLPVAFVEMFLHHYVLPGVALALFAGWITGTVMLLGNIRRRK